MSYSLFSNVGLPPTHKHTFKASLDASGWQTSWPTRPACKSPSQLACGSLAQSYCWARPKPRPANQIDEPKAGQPEGDGICPILSFEAFCFWDSKWMLRAKTSDSNQDDPSLKLEVPFFKYFTSLWRCCREVVVTLFSNLENIYPITFKH